MNIAIVILNWNGSAMMRRYLPSVIKHSSSPSTGGGWGEVEVIVADNASTDDSLRMLSEEFPEVRTIVMARNWGFAEGYNKSLRMLDMEQQRNGAPLHDYYLLLNSDVRVEQGWLTPMLQYMEQHPEVAACQPKLLSDVNPKNFEYAGACGGYLDKYGYPYCRGRVFNTIEEDHGQYDDPAYVLWATGACLLIRRDDYWRSGGLDGRFFAHNEEIDLCWRLNIMGRKVACVPQSVAYHYGGGTLPQGNPRKTYLNFRNNLTMLYKNLPEDQLAHVMKVRKWLDLLAALQMLILGRSFQNCRAVFRARRDFRHWLHQFEQERRRIQSLSTHLSPLTSPLSPLSILWQYYVKGRKHYSQLAL